MHVRVSCGCAGSNFSCFSRLNGHHVKFITSNNVDIETRIMYWTNKTQTDFTFYKVVVSVNLKIYAQEYLL